MPKNCYTEEDIHSIGESYGFSLTIIPSIPNYHCPYVRIERVWPFSYCKIFRANVIKKNSKFPLTHLLEINLPPGVDSLEELLTSVIMEKTFNG